MMRSSVLAAAGLGLLLSGCSQEPTEEQLAAKAREDEVAIASVEAAQVPPPRPVKLSAITFQDVERENMFGAGCNFASVGDADEPFAIAQGEGGFLKVDSRIERFAPDAGSAELPYNARERYTSTTRSFRLQMDSAVGRQSGSETVDYPGRLTVSDDRDRVVYQADGVVQCGA